MKHSTLCLGIVLLLSLLASAQTKDDIIPINGGRNFVYVKPPRTSFPAVKPPANLVTIYSNLGTGNNVYNAIAGTGVLGKNVPNEPFPEWLANGFTPTANYTVTEIQVGVTWVEGANSVILSLNADNGG